MKRLLIIATLLFGITTSEANLENKLENVDSNRLTELVGRPEEGNILEKVSDLFFRSSKPVNIRIEKSSLDDYFTQTENRDVRETAEDILEYFGYIEINSEIGGGVKVGLSDVAKFSVKYDGVDVNCELSPYKSTILDKYVSQSGEVSYVFRVDNGYSHISLNFLYSFLGAIGVDRAQAPKIKDAKYILSFGGEYYALFNEGGERMERIFDIKNNKYGEEILSEDYGDAYFLGEESVRGDIVTLK
ncbi:hypothetical protein HOG16_00175 [Candidatus Woesearchaeota archaeon]|jgi:hypothetical protein|nr:hypothetical protein [Candidatus Woesearchaeota archaeon]MBT4322155.1 hypothetical protein [Candidatus Woesearchaeota archaeon]MBT4630845.1 hypothetical protein [Candidatus Woesearchaeota archaeon]